MSKDKYPTILADPGAASQAAPCKQNPFLLLFSVIRIKAKRNERGSARRGSGWCDMFGRNFI